MLSKRQIEVLKMMVAAEEEEDWDATEIVREDGSCWLGFDRISSRTLDGLLRHLCLSEADGSSVSFERFKLNGTGRTLAANPEKADDIIYAIHKGGAWDEAGNPMAPNTVKR